MELYLLSIVLLLLHKNIINKGKLYELICVSFSKIRTDVANIHVWIRYFPIWFVVQTAYKYLG